MVTCQLVISLRIPLSFCCILFGALYYLFDEDSVLVLNFVIALGLFWCICYVVTSSPSMRVSIHHWAYSPLGQKYHRFML